MPISDDFWSIIDSARGQGPLAPSADPDALKAILENRPTEEVAQFGHEFYQALIDLNRWTIWGAASVMAEYMGDDSFHYFRSWLIGKGKSAYETALRTPDELGKYAETEEKLFCNEELEYVATDILAARGLPDPREAFEIDADSETLGEAWEEEEFPDRYPALTARYR